MSQPEMQSDGPPREDGDKDAGQAGQSGRKSTGRRDRARRDDLLGRPFPLGDWEEPADRLEELYRWAEARAGDTVAWYLRRRRGRRRCARALRLGAAVAVTAGVALPLLELAGAVDRGTRWGYLALLAALVCVGCDRFFGLTSGWMRDVATAQAVQRRLEALQFDWSSESIREVLGPAEGSASEAADRCLTVLRRFCEDVSELVRFETADWMVEFRSGAAPLITQSLAAGGPRGAGGQPPGRFPMPPGIRPNMPRQRPPDAR